METPSVFVHSEAMIGKPHSMFSPRQQHRRLWEHMQWAGGEEKPMHSARGEGRA